MRTMRSMFQALAVASAAMMVGAVGAPEADNDNGQLVGRWACTGQNRGMAFVSHFDYRPDGSYISNQQITFSPGNMIEGGGGGFWRLNGDVLTDTKTEGRLDRFIRNGVVVPEGDPEYQQVAAGARANLGATTQGRITLNGDRLTVGFYSCERQR